ncbi:OLC1v1016834C1 [Oldenlandia corymbosa var. corymbosa]|nr:OLC1v1016834C1 [Oldenlandia corymbosa var. corymbosa]
MAVDLMTGFRTDSFAAAKMEETAVQEAATAGLQSVEKLIRLLSTTTQSKSDPQQATVYQDSSDYQAVADAAVHKFKKFISLLDRTRTGHARFRRGPVNNSNSNPNPNPSSPAPPPPAPQTQKTHQPQPQNSLVIGQPVNNLLQIQPVEDDKEKVKSGSRIYCPTPIQGLPPLPHNHHQLVKSAPIERKESSTTINFASASPVNSYMSSLTGDTESLQPSMSSGFQITNLSSHVSSAGKPPLSTSSFKRKCSSMDDSAMNKCHTGGAASSGGRCHCPKKRKSRMKRVVRVPAISMKMADIPPDDYSWRKYGQKPIKGSPHPR